MKKQILTFGGLLGVIFAISGYLYLHAIMGMMGTMVLTFGAAIIILFLSGIQYRKNQEGFASFGELIKMYVGIIALSLLISTTASITQIAMMNEDSKIAMTDKIISSQLLMYETMGVNEDFMDEMEDQLREKTVDMLNPGSMISGSVFNFIIYFLIALIPAAILKRN